MDKIENDDYSAQLRSLRLILGKNYRQISTATLAAMVHLEPVMIRGIEAGRRLMNDNDRAHLEVYLGARWDPQSRQWVCAVESPKPIPFTRLEYEIHVGLYENFRTLIQGNMQAFGRSVTALLHAIPSQDAQVALIKLHQLVMAIAREHPLSEEQMLYLELQRPQRPEKPVPVRVSKKEKAA